MDDSKGSLRARTGNDSSRVRLTEDTGVGLRVGKELELMSTYLDWILLPMYLVSSRVRI